MLSYSEDSVLFAPADYDVKKIGFILINGSSEDSKKNDNKYSKTKPPVNSRHKCHICVKPFMSASNLRRHMSTIHSGIVWICEICNLSFTGVDARRKFSMHKLKCLKNKNLEASETVQESFDCDVCGQSEETREDLIWHLEVHRKLDIEIDDIFA